MNATAADRGSEMKEAGRLCAIALLIMTGIARADTTAQITATLDGFHAAAGRADSAAYFGYMTKDVIFLGTDGSERWQGTQFRELVESRFEAGRGWSYQPLARNIAIGPDAQTAWFDETLSNAALGNCRGSGVLVLEQGHWKIAQYNLSVPIPNAMMDEVAAMMAQFEPAATSSATGIGGAGASPPEEGEPAAKNTNCARKGHKSNRVAGC
jgi:hypothetical protein